MFKDRKNAGGILAQKLKNFKNKKGTVVFGITRGGVVVAKEISMYLKLPLEIIVIKKIGAPLNPELAIGAVGPGRGVYWDERLFAEIFVSNDYKKNALKIKNQERSELEKDLREGRKSLQIKGKTILLIDDGIATGATVLCAVKYFRKKKAGKVMLATPVIAKDTYDSIGKYFDSIIAIKVSAELNAIGQFYQNFKQVENKEVKNIIERQ